MIQEIAKEFGVKLYEVKKGDNFCEANSEEYYIDSSYCAGNLKNDPEIWLGIYEDEELKLISFFHEMGHIIDDFSDLNDNDKKLRTYHYEKRAWDKGYELAKKYDVKFTRKSKGWATKQLNSYKGWEEREMTNWEQKKEGYLTI